MTEEPFKSIISNQQQFERFIKIIGKQDKKGGLEASMVTCASMLLAVQSHMVGAFGHTNTKKIMEDYFADNFKKVQPH